MKIAILNKYQNKVYRGAETFVFELSKRLSKNNIVDVISDVDYFTLFKEKYDVIMPTNGRWQSLVVRLVSWLSGAKMVISGQSGAGFDDRLNLYCQPDVFVALSTYQKIWASGINPIVRSVYIPNGVDLNLFYRSPNKIFKDKQKLILSVGAFTKEKRHDLTIRAVSKLSNAKLTIVGSGGDLKDEIYNLGTKILGKERFEVLTVTHKEMPAIYKKFDLFAFPTVTWESFGIVLVEAMASGLPVVATNDPIRKEIVGDAGILVDPENINDYSNALRSALNADWKDKPRKQAESFSWDRIAGKYEELFKTLLNKK